MDLDKKWVDEGCCFRSPFLGWAGGRGGEGRGLFWLFLVHLIILTQMLFSLFGLRVWIRNVW